MHESRATHGPAGPRTHFALAMVLALCVSGCIGTIDEPSLGGSGAANAEGSGAVVTPGLGGGIGAATGSAATTGGVVGGATTDAGPVGTGSSGGDASAGAVPAPGEDGGTANGASGALAACAGSSLPLAANLELDQVAIYQAVKIPLMQNGNAVGSRNAPVVQGRDALLRAFVSPQVGFSAREVVGVLQLTNGTTVRQYEDTLTVGSSSSDGLLSSTLNFEINGADIGPSTTYALSVHESSCSASAGTTSTARFPASGSDALEAINTGLLRVKLVPIHYTAGGASVTSRADTGMVERMRQAFMTMYPVADVEITVRSAAFEWNQTVGASGLGWESLLNAILALRDTEADADEYYYGLVTTSSTFAEYCNFGCVAGIAPVGQSGGFFGAASPSGGIGVGFDDAESRETAVHEIGHAHGQSHAPCAPGAISGVDGDYPYAEATIGSWGYDLFTKQLKAPSGTGQHFDIMSYCDPTWVSDYTYAAWADWSRAANFSARLVFVDAAEAEARTEAWHSLIVYGDGRSEWGEWQPHTPPAGRAETAAVLDANGALVTTIDVVRMTLSDSDSEFLFLPDPQEGWDAIELSDCRIELP